MAFQAFDMESGLAVRTSKAELATHHRSCIRPNHSHRSEGCGNSPPADYQNGMMYSRLNIAAVRYAVKVAHEVRIMPFMLLELLPAL